MGGGGVSLSISMTPGTEQIINMWEGRKKRGRAGGEGREQDRVVEGREGEGNGKVGREEEEEGGSKQRNESSLLAAILSSAIPGRPPTVMHRSHLQILSAC